MVAIYLRGSANTFLKLLGEDMKVSKVTVTSWED